MVQVKNLTVTFASLSNVLASEVGVSSVFIPQTVPAVQHPPISKFFGIWDTGASASVITQKVVDALKIKPTGMAQVYHAQGTQLAETYLVNIILPSGVGFSALRVTKGDLVTGDVLIGMDVIGKGDFAVTNYQGKTVFTYRTPSIQKIDFTGQGKPQTLHSGPKVGRNDPCPCGSSKKFKKCCEGKAPAAPSAPQPGLPPAPPISPKSFGAR